VVPQGTALGIPTLGGSFSMHVVQALGGTAAVAFLGPRDDNYSGIPLPFDMTGAGLTGCMLRTSILLALTAVTSGTGPAQGQASVPLAIPNDPSLRGARLFGQWLVVDPTANPAGLVMSSAGAIVVQ
jgi:hypothetical protein